MPVDSRSLKKLPITPKVSQKMSSMMTRKMGMAKYLWVSTASIRTLRTCSRLSPGLTTAVRTKSSMKQ